MHPALAILLTTLVAEVITWIGKDTISNALQAIFVRLFHSSTLKEQRALKTDIYATKHELDKTSSQDEFAKWAKLRRKYDKGMQDLEKINATIASTKSTFPLLVKALLFFVVTVIPFGVKTYHRKTPVFWLPPGGWFGPIGWALSLPGAPSGSISATIWGMVCSRILVVVASTAKDLFMPSGQQSTASTTPEKVPVPVTANPSPAAARKQSSTSGKDQADTKQ
ncbi:GET complex subunit get1 [Tilletia horrida]|uniref:GET complex subunit get1 n=1 Tax=Tilletia horrida TaxID=155126 RepID=A0AAN6GNP5_9BASI|nr:GET complex subunit get1 [Tilletia horrida]KAK0546284.1 GET complex subunit get1 [Tilletia horrida]KAK0562933.1 GET complex subunit get1 [Tilletia horrida]